MDFLSSLGEEEARRWWRAAVSLAERLSERCGWQRIGVVEDYAGTPEDSSSP